MIFDSFRGFFSASERNWSVSLSYYDIWFSMNMRRKSNGFSSLEMIYTWNGKKWFMQLIELSFAGDWFFDSLISLSWFMIRGQWGSLNWFLTFYVFFFFFQEFFCSCSIHWGMDLEVPPPLVDKVNMVADDPLTRFVLDDNPLSVFRQ